MIGAKDYPVELLDEDRLSLNTRVEGFSDFILNCVTPMTIAIQGDWGSGKTSFVNMVMKRVEKKAEEEENQNNYVMISFNAWQYTQFNMEKDLLTTMITSLTGEIKEGIPKENKEAHTAAETILSGIKFAGKLAFLAANEKIKDKYGMDVYSYYKDSKDLLDLPKQSEAEKDKPAAIPALQTIKELKEMFQKCVNARLGIDDGKTSADKRLIIYIDDLDRLSPDKAVEVLEILKIFLDCKNCVFLLAIDYSVVMNGVAIKYKGTLSEDKGKDYFEKMIQVVYTMPRTLLHTDRYIASMLRDNGMNISISAEFAKLVKAADKDNPRSIKRLVNSYALLGKMYNHIQGAQLDGSVALFAMLCLQNTCEALYDFLLQRQRNLSLDFLNALKAEVMYEPEEFALSKAELFRLELIDRDGERDFKKYAFLKVFFEQLVECVPGEVLGEFDYDSELTEENLEIMNRALQITEISGLDRRTITEDDSVAQFTVGMDRLLETVEGTVQEAYTRTIKYLLESSTRKELEEIEGIFSKIISLSGNSFNVHQEFSCKDGTTVYINIGGVFVSEMADYVLKLAEYLKVAVVWFKDKGGKQELIKYFPEEEDTWEESDDSDEDDLSEAPEGFWDEIE